MPLTQTTNKENYVSKATLANWSRLNSSNEQRLCRRANKIFSDKKILCTDDLTTPDFEFFIQKVIELNSKIEDIIFSLCIDKLKYFNILNKQSVKQSLAEYNYTFIDFFENTYQKFQSDKDFIGKVYQSLTIEGVRNQNGIYYTPYTIAEKLLKDISIGKDELFLDPCCGSGVFLCSAKTDYPENIYGIDIDPIAVMIAKTNLLCKYSDKEFMPNIFCFDFLSSENIFCTNEQRKILNQQKYDYIFTNPPWGNKLSEYKSENIKSKEKASLFIEKSCKILNIGAKISFVLPSSIVYIKIHSDIRKYLIQNTDISNIIFFNERFSGVFTDFVNISMSFPKKNINELSYTIERADESFSVTTNIETLKPDYSFILYNNTEQTIISKMEAYRNDNLSNSLWALGIVTGNNKEKIKTHYLDGLEPIYTGKEICKFTIKQPKCYILYDRTQLQQCAKDSFYRAKEKLLYKFISKSLTFAYDDSSALVLNSANILIPQIETMSIKSVLCFLNSELYQFAYTSKFSDIKVLRTNLEQLPFPKLSLEEDKYFTELTNNILSGKSELINEVNNAVYDKFNISTAEQEYIKRKLYEKTPKRA